jgi:hypothetical protein
MPWTLITGFLGGYWKWILGALVAAGLAWGVMAHFRHVASLETQVGTLTQELNTVVAANQAAKIDYETKLAQDKNAYNQALADKDQSAKEAAKLKDLLNALNQSPPGRDGPIAPVLNDLLDGLYGP